MPYKELSIQSSTSWKFEEDGTLEGIYVGSRKAKSKRGNPITFHEFKHLKSGELVSILGGAMLDRILSAQVQEGQQLEIEFLGEKEGKEGNYKNYKVSIWQE